MADSPDFPIPPANFLFLVESILMQAQMQLGLLNFAENSDEEPELNLPLARHSIDLLGVLQEKTKGNLTTEEHRLLENGITELRFRFVQISDRENRKNEPMISSPEAPSIQVPFTEKKKEDDRPLIITPDGGKGSKTE